MGLWVVQVRVEKTIRQNRKIKARNHKRNAKIIIFRITDIYIRFKENPEIFSFGVVHYSIDDWMYEIAKENNIDPESNEYVLMVQDYCDEIKQYIEENGESMEEDDFESEEELDESITRAIRKLLR